MLPPDFYKAENVFDWDYHPNTYSLFTEAVKYNNSIQIPSSRNDKKKIYLINLFPQKDIVHDKGSFYCDGSTTDLQKTIEFIYQKMDRITALITIMKSHLAYHIMFPYFWVDHKNAFLEPYAIVNSEKIQSGYIRPNPELSWWVANNNYEWLKKQVFYYCYELERKGSSLILWPPHCIAGTKGHCLSGAYSEVQLFHSYVRDYQPIISTVGSNVLFESKSIFNAEVGKRFDKQPMTTDNTKLFSYLSQADALIFTGQSANFNIVPSINYMIEKSKEMNLALLSKIYLVSDCMSNRNTNKTDAQELKLMSILQKYKQMGINIVETTDLSWIDHI